MFEYWREDYCRLCIGNLLTPCFVHCDRSPSQVYSEYHPLISLSRKASISVSLCTLVVGGTPLYTSIDEVKHVQILILTMEIPLSPDLKSWPFWTDVGCPACDAPKWNVVRVFFDISLTAPRARKFSWSSTVGSDCHPAAHNLFQHIPTTRQSLHE
jgi:hypothetical protein